MSYCLDDSRQEGAEPIKHSVGAELSDGKDPDFPVLEPEDDIFLVHLLCRRCLPDLPLESCSHESFLIGCKVTSRVGVVCKEEKAGQTQQERRQAFNYHDPRVIRSVLTHRLGLQECERSTISNLVDQPFRLGGQWHMRVVLHMLQLEQRTQIDSQCAELAHVWCKRGSDRRPNQERDRLRRGRAEYGKRQDRRSFL